MATKYTYIYCRISADQQGRAEGVQAQERWGREYAEQHWPGVPVKVFVDNDLSAASDNVIRPEFEQMREGIRRGECVNLWAVEQSRLTRKNAEWFELAADLVRADVSEVHTNRGGVIDVDGVVAGIMAVLSSYEVKQLKKRLLDKQAELAKQGRPGGGGGFGYRQRIYSEVEERELREWQDRRHQAKIRHEDMRRWKDDNPRPPGGRSVLDEQGRKTMQIVPGEAEILREAARRVLSGWSLTNICAWMHREGVRGKHGGRIVPTTLAGMLTTATVAGYRVHNGEILGKGIWEPILDEATWRAVRAVIGSRQKSRHRVRRSYLLTGYRMFCTCGKAMQARGHTGDRDQYAYYACDPKITDGCGKVTIDKDSTEAHVAVQLFKHLEERDAAGLLSGQDDHNDRRDELVNELQALDARRTELAEMWNNRKLTTEQFSVMNDGVDDDQRRIEHELADLPAPVGKVDPAELREAWPELTLDEKRKVVDDWIEKIVIQPATSFRPTMNTVAEHAGVAQATAWRVLRGKTAPEKTVRRVMAAAEEVGYELPLGHRRRARRTVDPDRVEIHWR